MANPQPGASSPPALEEFQRLDNTALTRRYAAGIEKLDHRVVHLSDDQLDTAFLPAAGVGRWPARVLVGHLVDAELAFVHRMRRVVAEDGPVFAVWDENAFIERGLYGVGGKDEGGKSGGASGAGGGSSGARHPIAAFVAVLHTMRRWTGEWLTTLAPSDWERKALHPERGEQTLRRIMEYATWHLEHHAWYLNRKIELMAGSAPR